ncbi:MAG: Hsp70 family protein [Thermodesulfobacteriota bacterium]
MSETIIGIDLGTTNSEVAVVEKGRVTVIGEGPERLVPSVVSLDDHGGILVGRPARNQLVLYPERTVRSIKRRMGESTTVAFGDHQASPQEISALILRHLKAMAEEYLGHGVGKAVITVPAYFNDAQRQATREAGEIAGLEVVRIINEPTAAALSYEVGQKGARRILVYDLGGGTFDVSVVRMEAEVVEVVASHGNNHLGGDDFDDKLVDHVVAFLQEEHGIDARSSRQAMARIARAAEEAKCRLSDQPFAVIREEYLLEKEGRPVHLSLEVARDEYEEMIASFIDETLEAVHVALRSAGLTVRDIDEVLLVGGSTRTPLVRRRLEEEFARQPRGEIDADLCVAMGAAIQGAMMGGGPVSAVLVDITPYTFGTSAVGMLDGMPSLDVYVPIIRKNSPIPVTRSEVFYTMHPGQKAVDVRIYQGERTHALENIEIGAFTVTGLDSRAPAGSPIVLRLQLDTDGLLHVAALEKHTGLERAIVVDNAISRFEEGEMAAAKDRVQALFGGEAGPAAAGGRQEQGERQHRVVQARALAEKAERMLDQASAEDREDLVNLIEEVRDALATEDAERLRKATEELADILYFLEQ